MPKLGRSQTLGYAKDSTRNTIVTTATKFVKFKEFEANVKNEYFDDDSAWGRREGLLGREIVQQSIEGSLEAYLDVDGLIGEVLFHTFGAVTTLQPGTLGAYTHTFNNFLNQVDLATFTLQYSKGEIGNKRLKGGTIKSLEISFTDKECTFKAEIMGMAEEAGDAQTVVITKPTRYLLSKLLTSKWATTIAGLGAGTAIQITELTINIDVGAKPNFAGGSVNPIDNLTGTTKIEFSFAGLVRNTTWDLANLANTKYAYEFDCNMTNLAVLGTSALSPRLRIRIPPSTIEITTKIEKDDYVAFEAKGMAEFSVSEPYQTEILLQNTTISY